MRQLPGLGPLPLMSSGPQSHRNPDSRTSPWALCCCHISIFQNSSFHQNSSSTLLCFPHPHAPPYPPSQARHPAAPREGQRAPSTDLSMRRWHTMPRMSTSPVSFSCWHPILVAMKHPVRPMPALQDGHGCAEHPQHCSAQAGCNPWLVCCPDLLLGGFGVPVPAVGPAFLARHHQIQAGTIARGSRRGALPVPRSLHGAGTVENTQRPPPPGGLPWVLWLGPGPAKLPCSLCGVHRAGNKPGLFMAPCQCCHPSARAGGSLNAFPGAMPGISAPQWDRLVGEGDPKAGTHGGEGDALPAVHNDGPRAGRSLQRLLHLGHQVQQGLG